MTESAKYGEELVAAWNRDLGFLGGELPNGKPNSSKQGIQRSNGLPYAEFARLIRDNYELRRCWDLLVQACGRESPWPDGNYKGKCVTSFDGILYTTTLHQYQGLPRHVDTYKECQRVWSYKTLGGPIRLYLIRKGAPRSSF